jgi:hypothetical protein
VANGYAFFRALLALSVARHPELRGTCFLFALEFDLGRHLERETKSSKEKAGPSELGMTNVSSKTNSKAMKSRSFVDAGRISSRMTAWGTTRAKTKN